MKNLYRGLLTAISIVGLWLGAGVLVSAQTPVLLKPTATFENLSNFISTPNGLYFVSSNFPDYFLWKTDGTPMGTQLVKTAAGQFIDGSLVSNQVVANGRFYFVLNSYSPAGTSSTLWYIDGSGVAQTVNTASSFTGSISSNLLVLDNQLYFSVYNTIWKIDGDGTTLTRVATLAVSPSLLTLYGSQLYFVTPKSSSTATETANNVTLWRIPLPATSAVAVKDIPIQSDNLSPRFLQVASNKLYIGGVRSATNGLSAPIVPVIYQSDGTPAGTLPVSNPADLNPYTDFYQPKIVNNQLFLINHNYLVRGLVGPIYSVKPDGSTLEVAPDIYSRLPAGIDLFHPTDFVYFKGLYYFSAYSKDKDYELWRSDGTLVKDIQTGPGSSDPQNFYVYNDVLYFTATDNQYRKLYRTDGTTAGTQPVSDLGVGTGISSSPANNLTGYKNDLFLTANSPANVFGLWKIPNETTPSPIIPTPTGLTLTQPTYDCTTGQLSLSTTGGNGQPIDYRIAGLRDWSASNTFTVPTYQRTGTSFTLEARQSGATTSLPFLAACQTTTPPTSPTQPTGTGLSLSPPAYDCNSGQLSLTTTGGNGQPVDYRIAGLRDWASGNTFAVPSYQRMGTSFTLEARQSGVVVSLPFTATCQTIPPATTQPLSVSALPLNCQTGALQLVTTGGDGTPIEYKVPGLGNYSPSPTFTVPTYQRTNTTFTLYARQNGREVTTTYTATCANSSRMASAETSKGLSVVVYPNPVGERFTVGVSGAAGQAVRFELTTLSGQTVVDKRAVVASDTHTETLNLPASGAGLYLLRVSTTTQSQTVKVLKP